MSDEKHFWIEVKVDHKWTPENADTDFCAKCGESMKTLMVGFFDNEFQSPHSSELLFGAFEEKEARERAAKLIANPEFVSVTLVPIKGGPLGWELRDS